jgi:hypothetical protein
MDILHFKYKISEYNLVGITDNPPVEGSIGYSASYYAWAPLYDEFDVKIGIVQFTDFLVNNGSEKGFFLNELAVYHIPTSGTISYNLAFGNDVSNSFFKIGDNIQTRITSASGIWVTKTGYININVGEDIRNIYIRFNI